VPFDFHFAASHRVAADKAGVSSYGGAAREAKIRPKVRFCGMLWGKTIHAFDNLDDAFLALALLATGRWNLHSELLRAGKESVSWRCRAATVVDVQLGHRISRAKLP